MSENLRRITSEQAREMGRKSGEARRNKKKLRELLPYMLNLSEKNKEIIDLLKKMGVDSSLMTNQASIIGRTIMSAKKGDIRATRLLFDIILNLDGTTPPDTPTFKIEFVKNEEESNGNDNENDEG